MRYGVDRYLNVRTASNCAWLGDSNHLAYLTDITGVPQIWRVYEDSGYPEQLTYFDNRIYSFHSLQKSLGVCFAMDIGGDEMNQIFLLRLDGSDPINVTNRPYAVHQYGGMIEDTNVVLFASNARKFQTFDICAVDLNTGERRIILENDDYYNTPAALSPNGRYLLYNKLKAISDNTIWLLDLSTGYTRQVPCHGVVASFTHPVWKSDSSGFYLLTEKDSEFIYIAFYDLENNEMKPVYGENWDIDNLAISHDDRYLAFTINEEGYSNLKILELGIDRFVEMPKLPRGVISHYSSMDWSLFGNKLAFSLQSGSKPSDIWAMDLDANEATQVTYSSRCRIMDDGFTEPELIHFESFDGLKVPSWLFAPQATNAENLPVIVNIHGGPEGQERPTFDPFIQYLVNQGFAVASPNVRGSTGYGKTYHHLDDADKRMDSVADVKSLVDHLIRKGIADPARIAVMGMSYGGFMTLASVTEYPDVWAAAVDIVGIANFETFLENTASYRRAHRESEYGQLDTNRDLLRRLSPIHKVDNIKCPLMVVHGANDPRVPISEAEQIVEKLQRRGHPVSFLRYEDEGHGITKLHNRLDCYKRIADFLEEYLRI